MSGGARGDETGAGLHGRAREIFLDLLELPAGERDAALDEEALLARCGGDREVRREALSLLEHHRDDDLPDSRPLAAGDPDGAGERFEAGQVFAGRYRMIAELGRGGMGVVHRAHDLVLDVPVAIKLLPRSASHRLDRLLNEVRMARQVSHPNVCRVFDFGEAGGETYLTMEYIDGEDLASLLARIGRLPRDKLLDLARQLCAGLAAAHAHGVLHRDLKPANVMIDGRGRVRITDFGIAAEAPGSGLPGSGLPGSGRPGSGRSPRTALDGRRRTVAGTPAYMAPEQLDGEPATARSDLYALGLVLHEMATGRPVFTAPSPAAYAELHRNASPTPPSLHVEHLDPHLERVILRCLEKDPRDRPASAREIASALPGADPLALALEAGETPSPSAVAAAHAGDVLPVASAAGPWFALLAVLAGVCLLADRTYPARSQWAQSPPEVMVDRAERVLADLGHGAPREPSAVPVDRAWGFWPGGDGDVGDPAEELFWYRRGEDLVPTHFAAIFVPRADFDDPPPLDPGMVRALFDARGRLLSLEAVPRPEDGRPPPPPDRDPPAGWAPVLEAAGLAGETLGPAAFGDPPPVFADRRAAWTAGDRRVRAAAFGGRVVFFEVRSGESAPAAPAAFDWDLLWGWYLTLEDLFWLAAIAGAVVLAQLNLRAGRGDLRGARKLAGFVVALQSLAWVLQLDYLPRLDDLARWELILGAILVQAAVAWLAYVALEPVARRGWPHALIAWTRLLAGRFRDPLVGRSLLIGALVGSGWVLLTEIDRLATVGLGLEPAPEIFAGLQLDTALTGRRAAAELLGSAIEAVYRGVLMLAFLVGLKVLLKRWGPALLIFVVSNGVLEVLQGIHPAVSWLTLGLGIAGVSAWLLRRLGLLAYATALFCYLTLLAAPVTLDASAWYAETGVFLVLGVAAVGTFGAWAAAAGRPAAARHS